MVEVAVMKLAYPSGMYTTQVIDVNVIPFVDIGEVPLELTFWERAGLTAEVRR
jgi:hypothetical protein